MRMNSNRKGFTLVELLVTIAIIATLAAASVAGYRKYTKTANLAVATSNMRQLQTANMSYASDHNGKYVPVYGFGDEENPGLKSKWWNNPEFNFELTGDATVFDGGNFKFPLGLLDPTVVKAKKRGYSQIYTSYGYNQVGMPGGWNIPGTDTGFRVVGISDPGRSAAFISSTDWIAKYGARFNWSGANAVEGYTEDGKIAYRHDGKALVAYYDGHVGTITPEQMRDIDAKGGNANIFWNAGTGL